MCENTLQERARSRQKRGPQLQTPNTSSRNLQENVPKVCVPVLTLRWRSCVALEEGGAGTGHQRRPQLQNINPFIPAAPLPRSTHFSAITLQKTYRIFGPRESADTLFALLIRGTFYSTETVNEIF